MYFNVINLSRFEIGMNLNKITHIDIFALKSRQYFYFQRNFTRYLLKNTDVFLYLKKNNVILRKIEKGHFYIKILNNVFFFRQKSTNISKCEYRITPLYLITFTCQRLYFLFN